MAERYSTHGRFWQLGEKVHQAIEAVGYAGLLLLESFYWLFWGWRQEQRVRLSAVVEQMVQTGVQAIPIVSMLSFTVGIMLAIQLIVTLGEFGAQSQAVLAIAVSVTREFGPLITGIVVAGRTASSLAARIGSMMVSQEVDALQVIGIAPVRYLSTPPLLALLIMMPVLTIIADVVAIIGGGLYSAPYLNVELSAYLWQSLSVLGVEDISQGLIKSVVFGLLIALVGVASGFTVRGGAEGVGRATTRAVVLAISTLVVADMVFTWYLNR